MKRTLPVARSEHRQRCTEDTPRRLDEGHAASAVDTTGAFELHVITKSQVFANPPVPFAKMLYRGVVETRAFAYGPSGRKNAAHEKRRDEIDRSWDEQAAFFCVTKPEPQKSSDVLHSARLGLLSEALPNIMDVWTNGIWRTPFGSLALTRGSSRIRGKQFFPYTSTKIAELAYLAGYRWLCIVLEETYDAKLFNSFVRLGFRPVPIGELVPRVGGVPSKIRKVVTPKQIDLEQFPDLKGEPWSKIYCHCGFENPLWVYPLVCPLGPEHATLLPAEMDEGRKDLGQTWRIDRSFKDAIAQIRCPKLLQSLQPVRAQLHRRNA